MDLDFAMLGAMSGMLGFSGDLAGMPATVRKRIAEHVVFFKRWRRFLAKSVAHLLSPPELMTVRDGWVVFQFQDTASTDSIVFAYRLGLTGQADPAWCLRGLVPGARYRVKHGIDARGKGRIMKGRELMQDGIQAGLPANMGRKFLAAVCVVERM